tara:strand:- start:4579 stop:5535 length:957 start_codon:yes stop_codon:yes gene_type:complete
MYRRPTRLNTEICKICNREFKNEQSLKNHIFNAKVKDTKHVKFREQLRKESVAEANLNCPVCDQKIFRTIKTHFNHKKDREHINFQKDQIEMFLKLFYQGYSAIDISKIKNKYTSDFSDKYVKQAIANIIGEKKYTKISKNILSQRRKKYWIAIPKLQRKKIMKDVLKAQWKGLTAEERRNHPWVKAGRKASLESAIKGSKNQKHAYEQLIKEFPNLPWIYNYTIDGNWQIDIASPKEGIFIEWDGRHHRIPIHGEKDLNNRKNRDKIKNKIIVERLKGIIIRVRDDGRENLELVKEKVQKIKEIINNHTSKPKLIQI